STSGPGHPPAIGGEGMSKPLLTPKQARDQLGISDAQLRALTDEGRIPFINVGLGEKRASRRYDPADLAAFVDARRETKCRSISAPAPAPSPMISNLGAVDLAEIRARRRSEKLKNSRNTF